MFDMWQEHLEAGGFLTCSYMMLRQLSKESIVHAAVAENPVPYICSMFVVLNSTILYSLELVDAMKTGRLCRERQGDEIDTERSARYSIKGSIQGHDLRNVYILSPTHVTYSRSYFYPQRHDPDFLNRLLESI
jgi:hypothetical protein